MRIANATSAEEAASAAQQLETIACFIELHHDTPSGDWYWLIRLFCRADNMEATARCGSFGTEKQELPNGIRYFERMIEAGIHDDIAGAQRGYLEPQVGRAYQSTSQFLLRAQ